MDGTLSHTQQATTAGLPDTAVQAPFLKCIYDVLKTHAEQQPNTTAILAPGRAGLSYAELFKQVNYVIEQLNNMGIGRNDRVGIVLPNGPEMAVSFLSVAAAATSAPLNPAYREPEYTFYLSDLNAKAVVILEGFDTPARLVADKLNIPIIELQPQVDAAAGRFTLVGTAADAPAAGGPAQPDDVALVLHTSGTTSRPKIVPLTQTNICTSAKNIRTTLRLSESDRCLNVMPLFHIHGLMGATFSSITAGASIVCTPGFDATQFFNWVADLRPTWYSAVPTIHQAILAHSEANRAVIDEIQLRFIRSSSSSLPPVVMEQLEQTFSCPVIESYGMTEASHQMTSNALPPGVRKVGSVGLPAGPEVSIMDEGGNLLPFGQTGEIVIRGGNVTLGYDNNPEANAKAFTNGWFRTGDQGYMDDDGFLYISGRLKELINRGGENIAPREIDEVLLNHPAVRQAVAFAVPHPTLGEDVATAVILKEKTVTAEELRAYAFEHLADFKVPSQILIVDEIPKGPTGKLKRIGLADKMTDVLQTTYTAPRNQVERQLAEIWQQVLGKDTVGIQDNFFYLGGDSITAAQLVTQIKQGFDIELPLPRIFQAPTITQLAQLLLDKPAVGGDSLVLIRPGQNQRPIFCIPGTLGNVFHDLGDLARGLKRTHPIYGFQDGVHNPSAIVEMAAVYINEMRTAQPEGPYLLLGVCSGGTIAFEMAQQLQAQGQAVEFLAIVEPNPLYAGSFGGYVSFVTSFADRIIGRLTGRNKDLDLPDDEEDATFQLRLKKQANQWALRRYVPRLYNGRIDLFLTPESEKNKAWGDLARRGATVHAIAGTHKSITGTDQRVNAEDMATVATAVNGCLARLDK